MKRKLLFLLMVGLLSLGLVACSVGLELSVTPNPMVFESGDQEITGTIKAELTGMGGIEIQGVAVTIYNESNENEVIFSYDTAEHQDEIPYDFPISFPFAFQSEITKQEFDFEDLLGNGYTVDDLIAEIPNPEQLPVPITSYEDLKGKTYTLKVIVSGTPSATETVTVTFN